MNLLLWRHAEAEILSEPALPGSRQDLRRPLTLRGQQQAEASARWLRQHLKRKVRVLCSPALRALQTAQVYCPEPEIVRALSPLADASEVIAEIGWPQGEDVLLVGHQPWLGRVASLLLAGEEQNWPVKKSTLWWIVHRIRHREEQACEQALLRLVIPPDVM